MRKRLSFRVCTALALVTTAAVMFAEVRTTHARDFFMTLFDTMSGRPPPPPPPSRPAVNPGGLEFPHQDAQQAPSTGGGRSTAYCVRTCDGRYFPVSANNEQSRAATCSSLCPAADTKVFYGSSIDHATSDDGKRYSSLPNAFIYRERLVSDCTCNGKDPVGLASISIEDDKTIRKGDIVAGEDGLIVATRVADRKRGRVADFSPAPQRIRERFERAQALALQ